MQVFKFGGASVKDAEAIKNVAGIVKAQANAETAVVVSAMGKMTNRLEDLVKSFCAADGQSLSILEEIKLFHKTILDQLFDKGDAILMR